MSVFLKMKKDREAAAAGLANALKASTKGSGYEKDERYFYPQRDANGNGSAVIRFLPGTDPDGNESFVKTYSHGFQHPNPGGKWFIDECPTTIGKECPVCEANSDAYGKGRDYYEKNASHRKRKTQFVANVLIVSDPKNPEREGTVMLYKFGTKIFDMINAAAKPTFEGDESINVFNPWYGANFKLRVTKKDGQTNYDQSKFDSVSVISNNDDEIVKILEKQVDLVKEFLNPSKFKSYDDLKTRFFKLINGSAHSNEPTRSRDEVPSSNSSFLKGRTDDTVDIKSNHPEPSKEEMVDEDEDPVAFFNRMANGG